MQSALKSVKGVIDAKVSLGAKEAVVKYDPSQAKVDDLIKAVKAAPSVMKGTNYDAKVKK